MLLLLLPLFSSDRPPAPAGATLIEGARSALVLSDSAQLKPSPGERRVDALERFLVRGDDDNDADGKDEEGAGAGGVEMLMRLLCEEPLPLSDPS